NARMGDEPSSAPLQRRMATLRARQPRDGAPADSTPPCLPSRKRASSPGGSRRARRALRRGKRLRDRGVRERGRRRDRVHAIHNAGRGGLVLGAASPNGRVVRVQAVHATKIYETKTGPVHALEDFSLDVYDGEFVCVLGPSGCGKTTLLWAMSGLHALTRGEILLDDTPVHGPRPHEAGMMFQDANLLPWRNLRKNIEFPFEIKKRSIDQERIVRLVREVGLDGFEDAFPRELSGGMQQRASIVRALAQDPGVML